MKNNLRLQRLAALLSLSTLVVCGVSANPALESSAPRTVANSTPSTSIPDAGVACLGYVDLESSVASLSPLQTGRVAQVLVHENDWVAAGTVLLRLEDTAARLQVAEAEVALEKARARLAHARKLPDQQQARLQQQREAAAAAEDRAAAARSLLSRKEKLVAIRQANTDEVAAARDELKQFEAMARGELARLAELLLIDAAEEVRQAELDVKASQIRLDQARHNLDECAVKAPEAGTVLRILAGPGDILPRPAGQAALLFAVQGRRVVRAELDQEFVSQVHAGQPALVRDDSPSGISWRGKVLRVADWYTQRRNLSYDASQIRDSRTAECLIALDAGQPEPRLGQRVRVTIGDGSVSPQAIN
jgi:HlyD family secretion protein